MNSRALLGDALLTAARDEDPHVFDVETQVVLAADVVLHDGEPSQDGRTLELFSGFVKCVLTSVSRTGMASRPTGQVTI